MRAPAARRRRRRRRAALAGIASVALLAPALDASAQVADGTFDGHITDFSGFAIGQAAENRVAVEVFGGGTGVRGRLRLVIGGDVIFGERTTQVCFAIDVEIPDMPVRGGGASGSVQVMSATAEGACSSTSAFTNDSVTAGDLAVAFEDGGLRGTVSTHDDETTVLDFVADRSGVVTSTSSTEPPLPGLDEAVAAQTLDEPTLRRIQQLNTGCIDEHGQVKPGCADLGLYDDLRDYVREQLGPESRGYADLRVAVALASLQDANGDPFLPSLAPLLPVLVQLQRNAQQDGEEGGRAATALKRLIGLVVAMELGAR